MLLRIILILVCCPGLVFLEAGAQGVERWVDSAGAVHYGDRAPEGVASQTVTIEPNVIDTDPPARAEPGTGPERERERTGGVKAPASVTVKSNLEEYAEQCRRNRGIDCEEEARQMIKGPAPVRFPGDPAIFPRPDLKPPPAPPPERHPMPSR
jgi:hypothetical protein